MKALPVTIALGAVLWAAPAYGQVLAPGVSTIVDTRSTPCTTADADRTLWIGFDAGPGDEIYLATQEHEARHLVQVFDPARAGVDLTAVAPRASGIRPDPYGDPRPAAQAQCLSFLAAVPGRHTVRIVDDRTFPRPCASSGGQVALLLGIRRMVWLRMETRNGRVRLVATASGGPVTGPIVRVTLRAGGRTVSARSVRLRDGRATLRIPNASGRVVIRAAMRSQGAYGAAEARPIAVGRPPVPRAPGD